MRLKSLKIQKFNKKRVLKKFHFYLRNIRSWVENVRNRFWSFNIRNSIDAARLPYASRL